MTDQNKYDATSCFIRDGKLFCSTGATLGIGINDYETYTAIRLNSNIVSVEQKDDILYIFDKSGKSIKLEGEINEIVSIKNQIEAINK